MCGIGVENFDDVFEEDGEDLSTVCFETGCEVRDDTGCDEGGLAEELCVVLFRSGEESEVWSCLRVLCEEGLGVKNGREDEGDGLGVVRDVVVLRCLGGFLCNKEDFVKEVIFAEEVGCVDKFFWKGGGDFGVGVDVVLVF